MMRTVVLSGLVTISLAMSGRALARTSCEDLRANLKNPNARVRETAAAALGKTRCQDSVAPLAALTRDADGRVRLAVVKALRELRDPLTVPALTTLLGDGAVAIRSEAIDALVEVYAERDRPAAVLRLLDAFSDAIDTYRIPSHVSVDPAVATALGRLLRDEAASVRKGAAVALGVLRGQSALAQLAAALQDPDAGVRAEAATAIEKIGSHMDGKALIPLLADESAAVRMRAFHAVGALAVREAGPALREAWDANRRKEWEPRILEPMARVRDPGLRDVFLALVQDSDPQRRRYGIEGLARISDGTLLPALKKDYQREGNEDLRLTYCFALTLLGDRVFVDSLVLALPHGPAGQRCHDYLVELGPSFLPELTPYLQDPSADVRAALVDVIADMEATEALPAIESLLNDANANVVDRATLAVARLKRLSRAVH
jgi:HEAT repeat protein